MEQAYIDKNVLMKALFKTLQETSESMKSQAMGVMSSIIVPTIKNLPTYYHTFNQKLIQDDNRFKMDEVKRDYNVTIKMKGGRTVVATCTYKTVHGTTEFISGVARCSPDDDFSFQTGAQLAIDRMWTKVREKQNTKFFSVIKYNEAENDDGQTRMIPKWALECEGLEVVYGKVVDGNGRTHLVKDEWTVDERVFEF